MLACKTIRIYAQSTLAVALLALGSFNTASGETASGYGSCKPCAHTTVAPEIPGHFSATYSGCGGAAGGGASGSGTSSYGAGGSGTVTTNSSGSAQCVTVVV